MPNRRQYAWIGLIALLLMFSLTEIGQITDMASESWFPLVISIVSSITSMIGLWWGGQCS